MIEELIKIDLLFYLLVALIVSIIDFQKETIPDSVMLPSIFALAIYRYYFDSLDFDIFYAIATTIFIFLIPLILNMNFGGGDLRFGIFSAIFLSFPDVVLFVLFSGVFQIVILLILRKKSCGFAPAMSLSGVLCYIFSDRIWEFFSFEIYL